MKLEPQSAETPAVAAKPHSPVPAAQVQACRRAAARGAGRWRALPAFMPAGAFGPLPVPPALVDRVVELAIAIQSIPAPTFDEGRRAEYVCGQFLAAGLADVQIDSAGNVYGRRAGGPGMTLAGAGCARIHASGASPEPPGQARPPLVVSAHTDTVFPLGTDLTLQRVRGRARLVGPGIGDNALGVAGLLGLAWLLDAAGAETPGDLWLVANSREEGLGDLCGMKAVVERFGGDLRAGEARIDAGVSRSAVAGPSGLRAGVTLAPAASAGVPASVARAYIVLEGMALGHIYHRGIRVRRCRITARTPGGHSWLHFGRPSAVHALLRLGAQLADLSVPASPKTTFNVGVISGGTSVNTIAAQASLQLDLRSEDEATLEGLAERVDAMCRAAAAQSGVEIEVEVVGDRLAGGIPREHPLVQLASAALTACGVKEISYENGSTDANVPLSQGLPSVCVGISRGGHAHRLDEYVEIEPIAMGMQQLGMLVLGAYWLPLGGPTP